MEGSTDPPEGYGEWLADVKARVYAAQQRAALAVNTEMPGTNCTRSYEAQREVIMQPGNTF